jgi:hypothetical protein
MAILLSDKTNQAKKITIERGTLCNYKMNNLQRRLYIIFHLCIILEIIKL